MIVPLKVSAHKTCQIPPRGRSPTASLSSNDDGRLAKTDWGVPKSSALGSLRSKSANLWATEEPLATVEEPVDVDALADMTRSRFSGLPLGRRVSRALSRFLIAFSIGAAARWLGNRTATPSER